MVSSNGQRPGRLDRMKLCELCRPLTRTRGDFRHPREVRKSQYGDLSLRQLCRQPTGLDLGTRVKCATRAPSEARRFDSHALLLKPKRTRH